MFEADYKEDENEDETTDKDVSDKRKGQEEVNLQCGLDSPVYFDKPTHMSENIDHRVQDECTPQTNSVESKSEEPVIHNDVSVSLICYGKDEKFREENYHPDDINYSYCSSNNQLCQKEEKNEGEDKVVAPGPDSDGNEDGGLDSDVTEEVLDKDPNSTKFDKQEVEIKQKDGLTCNQEDVVLPILIDGVKEEMVTSDNIDACGEECDGSSSVPSSSLLCLSEPIKVDDHSLSGITDAEAQISGIFDFKDCQHSQREAKEDQSDLVFLKKEIQCQKNETDTIVVLAQEGIDRPMQQHTQDQQIGQLMNNDSFDKASAATAPDTSACDDENIVAPIISEVSCPHVLMNNEVFDKASVVAAHKTDGVGSAIDAAACDNATIIAPIMFEGISHPDTLTSFKDQQSDQVQNNKDFSEVASGVAPVLTNDINPATCKINFLSFDQSELKDRDKDNTSYPGVGVESGISSMDVSPDLQDAGNEFDLLITDDVALSVINEDTRGMAFASYQSGLSQKPRSEPTDWAKYESFAANEDMFGHEIDDGYHRGLDQFMAQITASVTSFSSELKKKTDIKSVVEGVDIKESSGVSVQKKVEMEAEKEEDYEKTEISIMEATMDNNEWITDSNYQVLPWMNISVSSFAQDNTKTSQPPTEEHQHSSSLTDAACKDTDTTPSTEVKPTNTLSLVDENTENFKKVVAVQPMPQNVNVTFRIHYLTHSPYQTVAVTGNQQELGNWKGFIPLERTKDGHWATVVSLPAESHVEWKFVLVDKGEVCRWEECGNRFLDTGFGDDLIVHKWWGLL